VFFIPKHIKIIFFYFSKIIFNISTLKQSEIIKNILIKNIYINILILKKKLSKYNASLCKIGVRSKMQCQQMG